MKRVQVESSTIESVGYDPKTSTLEIEFRNGRIYQYFDVPKRVFDDLLNAPSAGAYLASDIKGVYRYARA